uniref:Translation initiation factor IF-2 n=1 Tax=Streptomyces sp. NBC_00008 TaxID=2903610 RepID=A0AAU2VLX0_9ACTN
MATSESAAAGAESGTPGSPVPRAAAVTVLAEEPSTGLFPAKPAAGTAPAPAGSGTPATVSGSAAPTAAEGGNEGAEEEAPQSAAEEQPEPETAAETEPETEPKAATATAATTTTSSATSAETATATTTTSSATSAETATATASGGATGTRRAGVLPLGRPGKPLIAAAVAGGLVLVGVPFLISGLSGPGDNPTAPSALAPAGSRMGPDGSGPGFVPGQQNAPGENRQKSDGKTSTGSAAGGSGKGGSGTGGAGTGAIHEAGTKDATTGSTKEARSGKAKSAEPGKHTESAAKAPAAAKDSSGKSAGTPVSTQQERVAAVTYSHFIGPGCDTPGFATSDQWRDGLKGWVGSTGSQTSYGCSGFYYSVPLSNSTTKSTGYAQWKFPTGSVTNGSCQVSVYIPNVKDISRVGGNPAHYAVHRYFEAKPSTQIDTFEINQTSHLGQWVNAGTFPVSTGKISIVLENRGKTSGNRHAAAAPIKVNCTAS